MEHLIPRIVRPFKREPGTNPDLTRVLQRTNQASDKKKQKTWVGLPVIDENAFWGEFFIQNRSMTEMYGKDARGTIYRFKAALYSTPKDSVFVQHQENGKEESLDPLGDEARTGQTTFYISAREIQKAPLYVPEINLVLFIQAHEQIALHPGTNDYWVRARALGRGGYRIYAYATTAFYDNVLERSNHLYTVVNRKTLTIPIQTYEGHGIESESSVIVECSYADQRGLVASENLLRIYDATYRDDLDQIHWIDDLPFSFDRDAVERAEHRRLEDERNSGLPGFYDEAYIESRVKRARKERDKEIETQKNRIKDLEGVVKTQKADLKYARDAAKMNSWLSAFLKMDEMRQKVEVARQNAEKARLATEKSRLDTRLGWLKVITGVVKTVAAAVWGFFTGGTLKSA